MTAVFKYLTIQNCDTLLRIAVIKGPFCWSMQAFNVINGGSHAGNKLAMQEFMLLPTGKILFLCFYIRPDQFNLNSCFNNGQMSLQDNNLIHIAWLNWNYGLILIKILVADIWFSCYCCIQVQAVSVKQWEWGLKFTRTLKRL